MSQMSLGGTWASGAWRGPSLQGGSGPLCPKSPRGHLGEDSVDHRPLPTMLHTGNGQLVIPQYQYMYRPA